MTLREVMWVLKEETYCIHVNERDDTKCETINASAQGSFGAIRKYLDYEVGSMWREERAMGILVKETR